MGKAGKATATPSLLEKVLHRRIQETYGGSTPSVDQIVDSFREKYPEYRRHKLQSFTGMVRRTLDTNNSKGKERSKRKDLDSRFIFNYVDDEDENTSPSLVSPMCKKAKKFDMLETKQVAERGIELQSESKSSSNDGEEDRSAVLTAEDEVYSFEPEFDLTKSMLRNKYSGSKLDEKPKSVELENRGLKTMGKVKSVDANGKEDGPMFKDLGGMEDVLNDLKKRVIIPLYHPELPGWLNVRPTVGILLHGPPGSGKTTLARAIANETGFPFYQIAASELVSGISGASEENIRELFSKAYRTAPSIVFIDEIDVIASKRENHQKEMERRIATQLMTSMDQCDRPEVVKADGTSKKPGYVLVIGATNRPDVLDRAFRRTGRFDREIALGVPDANARFQILKVLTRDLRLSGDIDLVKISRETPGFVGADLAGLVNESGSHAMARIIDERELELSSEENEDWWKEPFTDEEMEKLSIGMLDFELATKTVQASSKREGFSIIPNVTWEDVGGLDTLRREFDRYIVKRIKDPDVYERFGVDLEMGYLLYGPPGCGKTLIAKAVANAAGANFIYIKGPELLNKYVGEGELAVRTIFSRARTCSPCILFFDEVDALTTNRGKEGGWVVERLLNQLLVELDGADQRKGVYVIGATNRPDVMDRALLRPGRMGKYLYVPLPNQDQRGLILKALARKKPIDAEVDLIAIGRSEACANLSGADLSALMNEAALAAVEERFNKMEAAAATATDEPESSLPTIKPIHFEQALGKISPSVSDKQIQYYHRLSETFRAS